MTHDPEYYARNADGTEPHGYWVKSHEYEKHRAMQLEYKRQIDECVKAVREGRACWIPDDHPAATLPF